VLTLIREILQEIGSSLLLGALASASVPLDDVLIPTA
jgi:hypothetical protein